MKYHKYTPRLAVGLLVLATGMPTIVSAQAQTSLQNSNSTLQPQSAPTQQQSATNTLNQTGSLQNNNGSSVLNQNGKRSLGVVSNPNQAEPDVVATPSSDLKTDITKTNNSKSARIVLAIGCLAIAFVGIYILRRRSSKTVQSVKNQEIPEKPVIRPEPLPVKSVKKSRKQHRRKKKKSNQR